MPARGRYREIFNSDNEEYGGFGIVNKGVLKTDNDTTVYVTLPPLSGIIIRRIPGEINNDERYEEK